MFENRSSRKLRYGQDVPGALSRTANEPNRSLRESTGKEVGVCLEQDVVNADHLGHERSRRANVLGMENGDLVDDLESRYHNRDPKPGRFGKNPSVDEVGRIYEPAGFTGVEAVDEEAVFGRKPGQLPHQTEEIGTASLGLAVYMVGVDSDSHH